MRESQARTQKKEGAKALEGNSGAEQKRSTTTEITYKKNLNTLQGGTNLLSAAPQADTVRT